MGYGNESIRSQISLGTHSHLYVYGAPLTLCLSSLFCHLRVLGAKARATAIATDTATAIAKAIADLIFSDAKEERAACCISDTKLPRGLRKRRTMTWWRKERAQPSVGHHQPHQDGMVEIRKFDCISAIASSILVARRRLSFDPDKKLFFFYEPGKQVCSAVRIKNTSRSPVAFKFQTNAPKSCFMRPPNGILAPGETITATVAKFVEQPDQNQEKKVKDKFKIVSLKVKSGVEYTPELFDEQKESVVPEGVLRVVFLDPESTSPDAEKLKRRLAEADAAQQARKKPQEDKVMKTATSGGVLDEWKEQHREKQLAKQQTEGADLQ